MAETIPLTAMDNIDEIDNNNNNNNNKNNNNNRSSRMNNVHIRESNLKGPRESHMSGNNLKKRIPSVEISDATSIPPPIPPRSENQKLKYYHEQIQSSDGTITGTLIKRKGTLTRPERRSSRQQRNLVGHDLPPPVRAGATTIRRQPQNVPVKKKKMSLWECFSKTMTCCFFSTCLKTCGKMSTPAVQQAWREKVTLCIIFFVMMCMVGFITFFLQRLACPSDGSQKSKPWRIENSSGAYVISPKTDILIHGMFYNTKDLSSKLRINIPKNMKSADLSDLFYKGGKVSNSKCKKFIDPSLLDCSVGELYGCYSTESLLKVTLEGKQLFSWDDINDFSLFGKRHQLVVYNGYVLNLTDFFSTYTTGFKKTNIERILKENLGRDATLQIKMEEEEDSISCIQERFTVGYVDNNTLGCLMAQAFINIFLVIILGVVLSKFFMAVVFKWFMANRLLTKNFNSSNILQDINLASTIRTKSYHSTTMLLDEKSITIPSFSNTEEEEDSELYTMCLVTCYSEGEQGIKNTLDSLASTTYNDKKKLIFVIADGIIRGEGNNRYTPDIICGLINEDKTLPRPSPQSYIAIADGEKQHNMAKVHAGYFMSSDRRHCVPIIVVVKCGTPSEVKAPKPGNRGKRDSQLILMNFLSRVMFDDRMTPLDFDLCTRIRHIAKVNPDQYELVLMVDADTKVNPTSLSYMVRAMYNDNLIMGLCGETRIANKTTSFITCIQVFEYYISHHLGKGFESMFGGVTCLPGCFCMYRIKARKGLPGYYVPILANPDIVEEYSENVVDTLHKKNLLLLGEDRFLTTLMLRTFPKRKMMFVPQALCKTIVPDTFKVLLSQRRRWINSTIHNLMELVLVRDLCGTFCFSMQFVVGLELCGTVVLPAAIIFTIYLIFSTIITQRIEWVPILMLIAILGLPGVLIVLTSFKWNYVGWMLIYLISLPIWNFVLPLYAMWHFDDFSWGETRKVQGSGKDDHGNRKGEFDSSAIPLKCWAEYEKERLGIKTTTPNLFPHTHTQNNKTNSIHYSPQLKGGIMSPPIPQPVVPSPLITTSSSSSNGNINGNGSVNGNGNSNGNGNNNSNVEASLKVIGIAYRPASGQANLSTNPAVQRAVQLQQKQAVKMQMARQNSILQPNNQVIRRFSTSNSSTSASPLIGANQSIHSRSSTAISSMSNKSSSTEMNQSQLNYSNSSMAAAAAAAAAAASTSSGSITSPPPVYYEKPQQPQQPSHLQHHGSLGNGINQSLPPQHPQYPQYPQHHGSQTNGNRSKPNQQPINKQNTYNGNNNNMIRNPNNNNNNNNYNNNNNNNNAIYNNQPYIPKDNNNNNNNQSHHIKETKNTNITHLSIKNNEPPPVPPNRGISRQ